jgi:biotin synthase-like enzyme
MVTEKTQDRTLKLASETLRQLAADSTNEQKIDNSDAAVCGTVKTGTVKTDNDCAFCPADLRTPDLPPARRP